jgi:hypothetical protein
MDDIQLHSLSQVRHDLQLLPKQFETNPMPVLVEQYGKPVFAIVPIAEYMAMEGALDFIEENELTLFFEKWLNEIDAEFDETNESPSTLEGTRATRPSLLDNLDKGGLLEDPDVRQAMKEHSLKTLAKIEEYEKTCD